MNAKRANKKMTSKPLIIAILLILAGIIGFMSWIPFIAGDESYISYAIDTSDMTEDEVREGFLVFGILGVLLSVFAIIGGIFSILRKKWKLVMISSVCGLLILGNNLLMASILCFIAIIILMMSKDEYK